MNAQPSLNLTQKLGSVMMQIQSYLEIKTIVKFVQVSLFVGKHLEKGEIDE